MLPAVVLFVLLAGTATPPEVPCVSPEIRGAIASAGRGESFLLAAELNFMHKDRPRIRSWPIVSRGRDADSSAVRTLIAILAEGRQESCGSPPPTCTFTPSYGLRFHDAEPSLDMLISAGCDRWCFLRGDKGEGEYQPATPAVADSMKGWIRRLFPGIGATE